MNLQKRFIEYIQANHLFTTKDKLLLAASGGIDSVVLCDLCFKSGYQFSIAHCNFQLRGEESNRDENFVKQLAEKYKVEFYSKTFDTNQIATAQKTGIEETARNLRYEWFNELLNTQHSTLNIQHYLATAHHADDNIETAVMNFFRGTGISGIRGIVPKQKKIVRPLLFAFKKELQEYAIENKLLFVQDSTNKENIYTRNLFRNKILPIVEQVYPESNKNILANINRFAETEILYKEAIKQHLKKLIEKKENEIHIPVLKLQKLKTLKTILFEILKSYNFTAHQTEDAITLLNSESGKYVSSSTHRLLKNRNWLIITPNKIKEATNILIEADDQKVEFENGSIHIKKVEKDTINPSSTIAQFDASLITFPLLLRKWKQGDYFYPLGMKKKKKLNRFFIDQKLSIVDKEKVWVIEMNKKIIWVVGMRIDDRFKMTDKTSTSLYITFIKNE